VLVVEDEDALRSAIRRSLQTEGYAVLEAQNGAMALELLTASESAAGVELVLTDLRMPVMDGRQLAAALARLRPKLPIIFMSGFTAQSSTCGWSRRSSPSWPSHSGMRTY
jgi:CheY-like chemotaxis protein